MLSASLEYRRKTAQSSKMQVKATLHYPNGTTEELTGDDVMNGGMSFTQAVSSTGTFDIGAAIVGSFEVTLNNTDQRFDDYDFTNAEIVPYLGIELDDGGMEWLLKGHYLVEQPSSYGNTIKLSCLDYMSKFDVPYNEVATRYPASFQTIIRDICSYCEVPFLNADFANHTITVATRPDSDSITCRDVISYVAQASGNFARVDTNGRLELTWYDTNFFDREDWLDGKYFDDHSPYQSGDTADGGNFIVYSEGYVADGGSFSINDYAAINALSSETFNTDDVVITGIKVTEQDEVIEESEDYTEERPEPNDGQTVLFGDEGYVLSIEGNPFILYGMANQVANAVGERVVGMRFRPVDVSAIGDPTVEAGDPALIVDYHQRLYKTYITNCTYKLGGYETYICGAESAARNSASGFSALTKAVVELRKTAKHERSERQKAMDELARELAESSGIYITPERQDDGSTIYYMHDKPTKEESLIIWKMTATAIGISTDGGKTYPYGLDVSGLAILDRIYAIGLDADYITTGAISITDTNGQVMFSADYDTKQVYINADSITMQNQKLPDVINGIKACWGTCSTSASTQVKIVTCEDFTLFKGAVINVRFAYANTASNPKLNVNGTGAFAIYAYGGPMTKQYYWAADDLVQFVYSGNYWYLADSGSLAKIRITEDSIKLSVRNGKLGSNASITLSVNGEEQTANFDMSDVRQAFADDHSYVSINAGTVTFNSGTFVVNSYNFSVTSDGYITATAGTIGGFTITQRSLYNSRPSLNGNNYGVYMGVDGYSCASSRTYATLANGKLVGGMLSAYSESGYLAFDRRDSGTGGYGTTLGGRGVLELSSGDLGVSNYSGPDGATYYTCGATGSLTYIGRVRSDTDRPVRITTSWMDVVTDMKWYYYTDTGVIYDLSVGQSRIEYISGISGIPYPINVTPVSMTFTKGLNTSFTYVN